MLLEIFTTFFKIGLFTFGGGYAMISLVKEECIDKKNWISENELVNLLAIAESTPGPIAINMATYVGYKKRKFIGAIFATIGVILPSIIVIYLIARYLRSFLEIKIVSYAFFGIRIAVSMIIIKTAYTLINREIKNNANKNLSILLFVIYTLILFLINLFNIGVSSILLILLALVLGNFLYFLEIKK